MANLVNTAAGAVECAVSGTGPALLALHGGMGGWDQSRILADALLAAPGDYRVIAVSRPGYLGTPQDLGRTPEQQADLCVSLLDALQIDKTCVAAISAGGPSAVQFALRHPERCSGLILISCCTGHLALPPEIMKRVPLMRVMARFGWLTALMKWRSSRKPARSAMRSIADAELRDRTLAHPEAGPLMRALQDSVFDRMAARLDGTINDMNQFANLSAPPAEDLTVPVLVVHGTGDRVVPFDHGERVAKAAPHAELQAIEGGEHVAIFTHLDEIRRRAAGFMARHS